MPASCLSCSPSSARASGGSASGTIANRSASRADRTVCNRRRTGSSASAGTSATTWPYESSAAATRVSCSSSGSARSSDVTVMTLSIRNLPLSTSSARAAWRFPVVSLSMCSGMGAQSCGSAAVDDGCPQEVLTTQLVWTNFLPYRAIPVFRAACPASGSTALPPPPNSLPPGGSRGTCIARESNQPYAPQIDRQAAYGRRTERGGGDRRGSRGRHRRQRERRDHQPRRQPRLRERAVELDLHRGQRRRRLQPGAHRLGRPQGHPVQQRHRAVLADRQRAAQLPVHAERLGPGQLRLHRRHRDRRHRPVDLDAGRVLVPAAQRQLHHRREHALGDGLHARLVRAARVLRRRHHPVGSRRFDHPAHHAAHHSPDDSPDHPAHDAADHPALGRPAQAQGHRLLAELQQRRHRADHRAGAEPVRHHRRRLRGRDDDTRRGVLHPRPVARLQRGAVQGGHRRQAGRGQEGDRLGRRPERHHLGARLRVGDQLRQQRLLADADLRLQRGRHRPGERHRHHVHAAGAAGVELQGRLGPDHHDGAADDRHAVGRQ
ncbi:exported hypothetical protein [Actinacidiphila cocklensis]|uniref:Uncharacterized protein n=1 Tax=Actinacidiphila cocklensis TaxID=887465 RepID=A0A9W4E6D0_9ACTN|nr:exported hypothetical protein [Actinacidiphila cocklensis]